MESMTINEINYHVLRLLGKGKGGYSYLVTDGEGEYVLKQIHHEPCDYYTFGDKLQSELQDYARLSSIGIPLPKLLTVDHAQERILKEYIHGDTVDVLVKEDRMKPDYLRQIRAMCHKLYAAGLNIDYYPTNFVVRDEVLYYIDFECNDYMAQWDFENWGSKYWDRTPEFAAAFGCADQQPYENQSATDVVAALIWDAGRFMICQRPAHKARGLLWEFVGGKVEPGETPQAALIRECREELDVALSVGAEFMSVIHEYPDLTVRLTLFHAAIAHGTPRKIEHNDIRWITPAEIPDYDFCPADVEILERIVKEYGQRIDA